VGAMSTPQPTPILGTPRTSWLARVRVSRRLALPVLLTGTFMVVLDFFIVNVALPSLQRDLDAGASSLEWVVAGYALTSAVFLVSAGRLGDRLGHRRVFSLGLALFTLASAACGLAWSPAVLVPARLAQGVGAALLTPSTLSILTLSYGGATRVRAIKAYGLTMGLAAVSGQLIGGALVEADVFGLGWRNCFLINVPIGAAALALAPKTIPESRAQRTGRLDLVGTLLLTAALTAILLPLVDGRQQGWPAWTWLSLATAPLLLLAFAASQRRLADTGRPPLLDPALFRNRSLSAGLLTQLAFRCGQASYFLVLALYLQQGRGLSPLRAGLVFTILASAYVVASLAAPTLAHRHGQLLLAAGALLLAGGHGLLLAAVADVGVHGSTAWLTPGLLLAGLGMGLLIAPLTTVVLAGADPERAGAASGALATMQSVGNALGVAVTGAVFFGALGGGYAHALELSLLQLAGLLVVVAGLTRLLPPATGRA
jgi:EmrB/QacA subfamily drug resistance transporter